MLSNYSEVKLPKYQDSGRCKGYAHVTLNSEDSYKLALSKTK